MIIITIICILLITYFIINKSYYEIIKYFDEENRLVKNRFNNKYYSQMQDHYGWLTQKPFMDFEINSLKQYKMIAKNIIIKILININLKIMNSIKDEVDLIINLLKIKGAENCSGDASFQVILPLKDNTFIRIGVTDEDVAETQGLWIDYWEKIDGKLKLINKK